MKTLKRQIPFLLLFVSYFLFCNTTCEDRGPDYIISRELRKVELAHIDFSGSEMLAANDKVSGKAYVIGVRCYENVFHIFDGDSWNDRELIDVDVISYNSDFFNSDGDFDIITVNALNEKYPAGSSVRNCFKRTYFKRGEYAYEFSYMLVLRAEYEPGEHAFKVVYKLTDGETIEAQTELIELY